MVLSLFASCNHKDKIDPIPTPEPQPESLRPIEMSAATEWYGFSKGLVDSVDDLYSDGFVVWGVCIDPDDETSDIFGDNGTEVTRGVNSWEYSPTKYWHEGLSKFAAIRPSLSYTMSAVPYESTDAGLKLTVTFPDGGFDLKPDNEGDQADLMVAYAEEVYDGESRPSAVTMDFEHQLALVNIQIKGDGTADFTINDLSIFGNSSKAESAEFSSSISESGVLTIVPTWDFVGVSTQSEPFYSSSEDLGLKTSAVTYVSDLLVFPEQTTITVAGSYTEIKGGYYTRTEQFAKNVSVNWQPNMRYTYVLTLTSYGIVFSEPKVEAWQNGGAADGSIEM